ncbi:MAG TPA: hypothetical protein VKX28_25665 [Xanthobacteraceae bacterium]|nr:hypothetical protein [Xanthobacteraceae bacterium]
MPAAPTLILQMSLCTLGGTNSDGPTAWLPGVDRGDAVTHDE